MYGIKIIQKTILKAFISSDLEHAACYSSHRPLFNLLSCSAPGQQERLCGQLMPCDELWAPPGWCPGPPSSGPFYPCPLNPPHTPLRHRRAKGRLELAWPWFFCVLLSGQHSQICGFRNKQNVPVGSLRFSISWCWKAESFELSLFSFLFFRTSCLILTLITQLLISRRAIATFRAMGT